MRSANRAVLVARRDGESLAWAGLGDGQLNRPAGTEEDPILLKLLPLTHRVEGSVRGPGGQADRRSRGQRHEFALSD